MEGFDPGSGSQKAWEPMARPSLLARLSGCKFTGNWHPGWSSLSLLNPGRTSAIPTGIKKTCWNISQSSKALALNVASPRTPVGESAELVLLHLIDIPDCGHFRHERIGIEIVGLHQIVQGIAMIPQLGVEQADEEMGIHPDEV